MRGRSYLGLAAAAGLAACTTVGPNFKTPDAPKAAGYAMAGDKATTVARLDPQTRAAGPWWQAFGSADLDRTVREALANSPDVAQAEATLARYQFEARAYAGQQLPQVDVNAGAARERINLAAFGFTGTQIPGGGAGITNPTFNLFTLGGSVSYDLDLFGGRRRRTEEAQARAEQAARQADAAYLTLSASVAQQAMVVAGLRAEIAAVQEVVAEDRRTLEIVRRAQDAGGEAPAASVSATAQLAEDEALLPPLQRRLDAARHQLAQLVGHSPADWTAPDFDLAAMTAPAAIPVSVPSTLVRSRPDILAAEAELHAATAAIGVAVAAQYPDLKLSANLTQSAMTPDKLFNYDASGWNLLSGVTAPVFNGGTLKAERQAAEAEARASLARYQAVVLRAFVQVSDALSNLANDETHIAALTRAADAAAATLKNNQAGYRLGGTPLSEVVDAQRQLSRARRALAIVRAQQFSDMVTLYAATAADWRTPQAG